MSAAVISDCGRYRYSLRRDFSGDLLAPDVDRGQVLFVMLNPSTADASQDDPTIRRCLGFAKRWGFDSLRVANLYALRATDPRELAEVADPVGPDNDYWLRRAVSDAAEIVVAWGVPPLPNDGALQVLNFLTLVGRPVKALGTTKDGHPRHPLYVRGDAELQVWPPAPTTGRSSH